MIGSFRFRGTGGIASILLVLTSVAYATQAQQAAPDLPMPQLMHPLHVGQGELQVFVTSPTRWLKADEDPASLPDLKQAENIQFAAARHESEQVLLLLRSDRSWPEVDVEFTPLIGPDTLSEAIWSCEPVGYVQVDHQGRWYGIHHEATGLIPDPLLPPGPVAIAPDVNATLLLTLRVPATAGAGVYAGSIRIRAGDRLIQEIPVQLTVWSITLPAERSLVTMTTEVQQDESAYRFLKQKGINSLKYGVPAPRFSVDRETADVTVETANYLEQLDVLIRQIGFHSIALPPSLLGTTSRLSANYLSTRIAVGDEAFWPIYRSFMSEMADFYRSAGLADRVIFYMMDEIYAEHYPMLAQVAREAKIIFPEIRTMVVSNEMTDEVAPFMDIWVSPWHFFVTRPEDVLRWDELRRRGMDLWGYMNSLYTLNTRVSLKDLRFYPTILAKYGYVGNLWWSVNHFAGEDPWSAGIATLENVDRGDRHYANGYLFYPPRSNDPSWRSSLRWEAYEQGLDEYELMMLLKQKITPVRKALGNAAASDPFSEDQAMRWWGSLLSSGFRLQTYRRDGAYIHRFRQLLAHEIMHLSERPYALLDGEPDEAMWMVGQTLHLRGVVEAGARVYFEDQRVNFFDEEKPYVFWGEVPLAPGLNTVKITVVGKDGSRKTLVREVTTAVP